MTFIQSHPIIHKLNPCFIRTKRTENWFFFCTCCSSWLFRATKRLLLHAIKLYLSLLPSLRSSVSYVFFPMQIIMKSLEHWLRLLFILLFLHWFSCLVLEIDVNLYLPGLPLAYMFCIFFCRASKKLFGFLFSNGFSLYMYLSLLLSVIFSDVSCYSTGMEILMYFRFCYCPQKSATCTVTHFISSIFLSSLWVLVTWQRSNIIFSCFLISFTHVSGWVPFNCF